MRAILKSKDGQVELENAESLTIMVDPDGEAVGPFTIETKGGMLTLEQFTLYTSETATPNGISIAGEVFIGPRSMLDSGYVSGLGTASLS